MLATRLSIQRSASRHLAGSRGLASSLLTRSRDDWTQTQLKKEAKERGILQSGNKAALLARLQADDMSRSGKHISTNRPKSAAVQSTSPPKPSSQPAAETQPLSNVISPESTPVSAPARAAFKSTRTVRGTAPSSNASPGLPENDGNPFAPRKSAPLNIRMPDEDPQELEGPTIPVTPENYISAVKSHSDIPSSAVAEPPKVLSVSGLDEHLAAPSHPNPTVAVNPPVEAPTPPTEPIPAPSEAGSTTASASAAAVTEKLGQWSDTAAGYGKSLGTWLGSTNSKSDMSGDEKRGLYVLGGIVLGGWFLGGVAKKDGLKEDAH